MAASTIAFRQAVADNNLGQGSPLQDDDNLLMSTAKRRKLDNGGMSVPTENEVTFEPAASEPMASEAPSETFSSKQAESNPSDNPASAILYVPGAVLPKLSKYLEQVVEVRVASKYLSTRNKEVSTRQIWGTDIYTDDSDVVAICQHAGKIILRPVASQRHAGISAFFRVRPGQSYYQGTLRYKIQSRNWIPHYHKCSLELLRIAPVLQVEKLDPRAPGNQLKVPKSIVASGPTRRPYTKRRFAPNITIMFNFSNEPCLKYYLGLVADRGMDSALWTSTRLQKEVLYLNTDDAQFELARSGNNGQFDTYRWSRCKQANQGSARKTPLPATLVEVIETDLDWEEIEWGVSTLKIRSAIYHITTIKFLPMTTC